MWHLRVPLLNLEITMTMKFEKYNYFDSTGTEVVAIELMEGPFVGTIFSFGKVEFPNPDEPILNFEYTVHEGILLDKDDANHDLTEFRNNIGDILVSILEESIKDKTTIFKGGIDE